MRLVTLFALVLLIVSCGDKRRTMISKVWRVHDVQFIDEKAATVMSDTLKGNQVEVAKTQIREILMRNLYGFSEDGTYKTGNAAADAEGKWDLTGDAIRFYSETNGQKREKLVKIDKLEPDSLILLMQNDQSTLKVRLILIPAE